jgi:hypothetical protein
MEKDFLQKAKENESFVRMQAMLVLLANHLTIKTRLLPMTGHERCCTLMVLPPYSPEGYTKVDIIEVELEEFFGMWIGYNVETDTLVIGDYVRS